MPSARRLQFQDITRQMIEHVRHAIGRVEGQVNGVLDLAAGRASAADVLAGVCTVDDLRALHVMDRQRRNHAVAIAGAGPGSPDESDGYGRAGSGPAERSPESPLAVLPVDAAPPAIELF